MPQRIDTVLDHIAVAVPDRDAADARWRDLLGGRWVAWDDNRTFRSRQLRYRGGGKLELISPPVDDDPANFVRTFLDRFGAHVQHLTLKVPDLDRAIAVLRAADMDVVGVRRSGDYWHEAFLRPSQVGGLVVQVAWSPNSDEEWAALVGHTPEPPPADAAIFVGVSLRHPDLQAAGELWRLLGAEVAPGPDGIVCSWPDSPAGLVIRQGDPAGPDRLLFADTDPLPADPVAGPPVEVVRLAPALRSE